MKGCLVALGLTLAYISQSVNSTPSIGAPAAQWFKEVGFKKLYTQALSKSPVNQLNSWAYKDIGLAPSKAIAGQNGNVWVHLSTCSSTDTVQCRNNHIDIFYDVENQELFAYLSVGSRVGWMGNVRGPTSLEQKFFTPYLTAKAIR